MFYRRDATIGLGMMQTDPTQWKKRSVEELTLQEAETMGDWVSALIEERPRRASRAMGAARMLPGPSSSLSSSSSSLTPSISHL